MKTVLRYAGGKSKAIDKITPFVTNYDKIVSPFLGGGSLEVHWATELNKEVIGYDIFDVLVNFWQQLQMFGLDLKDKLVDLKSTHNNPESAKELFLASKEKINDQSLPSLDRAVAFYVVNKCSFSGLTESSSFSQQASNNNFSLRGIEKLPSYSKLIENWRITNYSYDYLMDGNKGAFMYLDPPYDIKDNLYGNKGSMHKGFDHDKFAADCNTNNMDMLVSYNTDQLVKARFLGGKWTAAEFDLTYTMRSVGDYMREQKQRKELLLFNYGIEGLVKLNQSDETESDG